MKTTPELDKFFDVDGHLLHDQPLQELIANKMQEFLGKERNMGTFGGKEDDKAATKLMKMARIWRSSNRSAGITAVTSTALDCNIGGDIGDRDHTPASVDALRDHWKHVFDAKPTKSGIAI